MVLRGAGEDRDDQNRLIAAAFDATARWRLVDLPFDGFKPENLQAKLDIPDRL